MTESNVEYTPAPGFPCPECGFTISVSIDLLVAGRPAFCNGCGLELQLDKERSMPILEEFQELKSNIEEQARNTGDKNL